MNGVIADPEVKTINAPKRTRTNNIGNNQYFFLAFVKFQNSFIKLKNSFKINIAKIVVSFW